MSFSKLVTENPHLLEKLDLALFGKTVVAHIVGMPQDATENNFMAIFTKDGDGNITNIRWKGFDDDRWGVHSPARSGKENHFNNLRSIFLNFKQMYQTMHPDMRKHFSDMNPARGILQFLKEMSEYNRLLKELQKSENIPAEKMDEMFLPFLLVKDLISKQYQKFCRIRSFMRQAPLDKTHMDMWQEVDPVLAHFYDMINKKFPNSPYEAFLKVFYRGGPTVEENMASLLSRPIVGNIPLSEYLKSCSQGADDYEALRDTPPELAAEQWLQNDLDFGIYSVEEQKEILKVLQTFPLTEITLRNCSALKDPKIRSLMQAQPGLQKLTLIGCDKLTNAALNTLFEMHSDLDLTLIDCPGITQEAILSLKSKNIKVRNRSELAIVDVQAVPEGFENEMKELSSTLNAGDWKQVRQKHARMKAAGIGDKAEIRIIEHLVQTDQMRNIVKKNQIEALEFLTHIQFKFTDRNIKEECLFHLCCQEGNALMLKWLCSLPLKWEEVVDHTRATPWHAAVVSENLPCLQVLKEVKAPVNLQDMACVGPLRLSLERKDAKIAKWLIEEAGASIEEKNWHKQTLLHLSCQNGLTEVVDILLARDPKMTDAQDDMGKAPINSAIEFGQADSFNKVLKAMKSVQIADNQGNTPLMQAAQLNHPEMVLALLTKGANPQDINKEEINAAQIAALAGSLPCLKALIGENPSSQVLSIKRKDGKTLLHLAALSRNVELIRWIARPELLTALDEAGFTAAHYAAQAGKWDVFSALVQAGFAINFQNTPKKETCLMLTLRGNHYNMADHMIAAGAILDAVDSRHLHPIHRAASDGDPDLIRTLVEKYRCDVNLPSKNARKTPLHFAAAGGHLTAMIALFSLNANRNSTTLDKETPLFFAVQNGKEEAVRLLIGNGAEVSVIKSSGDTLLHYAAWFCQPKLVAYLLSLKPDLIHRRTTEQGHTPLHRAMYQRIDTFVGPPAEKEKLRQQQLEVVKTLLRYGAEVDARDKGDYTPLHLTGRWGRADFARLLLSRGASVYARYDKSKFSDGKRIPEECRTPEEHCYYMMNTDDKVLKKAIEETGLVLKEHAQSLHDSQKPSALKKVPSMLLKEKGLSDLLAKPLEERKSVLFRNLTDDAGFRPDSLLLLRSIEDQLATQPAQESSLFIEKLREIFKGWNHALSKKSAVQHPVLKYDVPITTQQIRERWLANENSQQLEEIACMIPLLGRPADIFQLLIELSESNPPLPEKELKVLFALQAHLRGHEAWTAADFSKPACQRMTASLGKHKKGPLKDSVSPVKEFLDEPALFFPKSRLDGDWRDKGIKERRQKLLGELSEAFKQPHKHEELINGLTRSIMGLHKELFQHVKISDFRPAGPPAAKETASALSELLHSAKDLTTNCLILLLQDGSYTAVGQRLEFVIDWMCKSALYGDFHQAEALFEAISHPAVIRLRKAFDRLSSTSIERLHQLEKLFLPEANFLNYFGCLRQRLSPSIPSFNIFARHFAQRESPDARYAHLRNLQEMRAFAAKITLPPTNPASEFLLPLTSELFPQEYLLKRENMKPGESFAWERSDRLKPRQLKGK
ncbi:MAG: ankyrin repeat domain-containing protein [Parachlamydia sp.]|nr:ankyrin repeat domain-containing protein [Parachlamydia sp.]